MRSSFYILVSLMVSFLFSNIAYSRSYLPTGCATYVTCKDLKNEKGELHGAQTCFHASKKDLVLIKSFWKNDKLENDFFCANDEGVPVVEAHYKNGELDGEYKTYNAAQKKWDSIIHFKNGQREGVAVIGISDDRQRVTLYKGDNAHGFTLILDKNKKILSLENCLVNNTRKEKSECENIQIPGYERLLGDFLEAKTQQKKSQDNRTVENRHANGKISERYKIENGKTVGRHEYFYENGTPRAFINYIDGERVEEKAFYEDGQIKNHRFYKKSWNYKVTEFYQNGKKKLEISETESKEDKILTDVDYTYYYDNGKVSETGRKLRGVDLWSEGVYNGEIKKFSKSGHMYSQCTFSKGRPVKTCTRRPEEDEYNYDENYNEEGVLISARVVERKTEKQVKKVDYFPDRSTKSEMIDPEYQKKMKSLKKWEFF